MKRGKDTGRWVPLEYFLTSFQSNQGKIKALRDNNPNVQIVTINNAENKGIECSIGDAYNWDYTVNKEQFEQLKQLINEDDEIAEKRKEQLLQGTDMGTATESLRGEQESDRGGTGSQVHGVNSGDAEQRVGLDSTIQFYKSQGREIYGFLTKEGHIYLDETAINPEHPIHEYTHLWDRYLMKYQSELWKQGVSLMQAIPLWTRRAYSIKTRIKTSGQRILYISS